MSINKSKASQDIEVTRASICLPDRDACIAELAYLKAEKRGWLV